MGKTTHTNASDCTIERVGRSEDRAYMSQHDCMSLVWALPLLCWWLPTAGPLLGPQTHPAQSAADSASGHALHSLQCLVYCLCMHNNQFSQLLFLSLQFPLFQFVINLQCTDGSTYSVMIGCLDYNKGSACKAKRVPDYFPNLLFPFSVLFLSTR